MEILLDILLAVLIISASALCIYLILYLKKVTASMQNIEKDVNRLTEKTFPILDNLNESSKKVIYITSEAERHFDELNSAIINFKDKFSDVSDSMKFGSNPDNPIIGMIRTLTGISKGVAAFWSKFKNH